MSGGFLEGPGAGRNFPVLVYIIEFLQTLPATLDQSHPQPQVPTRAQQRRGLGDIAGGCEQMAQLGDVRGITEPDLDVNGARLFLDIQYVGGDTIEGAGEVLAPERQDAEIVGEPHHRGEPVGLQSGADDEMARADIGAVGDDGDRVRFLDQVADFDAEVDEMYTGLFREILTYMMEDPRKIGVGTNLLFMAKNLERIGDHATNLAELVHYRVTGEELPAERPRGPAAIMPDTDENGEA